MRIILSGTVILCVGDFLVDFIYPPVLPYDIRREDYLKEKEEKYQLSSRCDKLKNKVESLEQSLQVELNL